MSGSATVRHDYTKLVDEDLIEAFYSCSTQAGEELERRYRPRLVLALTKDNFMPWVRKLRSLVGRQQYAEDVVGDTIAELVAGKGRPSKRWVRGKGANVSTWLQRILHNRVATLTRPRPELVPISQLTPADKDEPESHGSTLENLSIDLEQKADKWQLAMLESLRECVGELPEELQRLVQLKFQENWKQKAIAKELGLTEPTLTRRKDDAMKQLHACMERKGFLTPAQPMRL
jgi:RNA polymerase sigma factor (sigma-70 family)